MSEQTPKRWEGTGRKDAPGGDEGTIWGVLQGVTVSKVWASVQGGVEERLSKVVKGHVLNFHERSKERKERIQVYDGKFIVHFSKILHLLLPAPGQGYHHVTRSKWEPAFPFFLFFFNITVMDQYVCFPVQALCFLSSASVLQFRVCDWSILLFSHLEPLCFKAGCCSTRQD